RTASHSFTLPPEYRPSPARHYGRKRTRRVRAPRSQQGTTTSPGDTPWQSSTRFPNTRYPSPTTISKATRAPPRSWAAAAVTTSTAAAATTTSTAATATTTCRAIGATTRSSAVAVTTTSMAVQGATTSMAATGTTPCSAAAVTTASRPASAAITS